MISTTITTTTITNTKANDTTILDLENMTINSDSSHSLASSARSNHSGDAAMADLESKIRLLDEEITPLSTKTQKKLDKIEDEISNCNFLIDSGIGSKKDQAALRKTKRQLRQRRVKIWDELKVLPALKDEKIELERQLNALRRQLGVIDDDT